MTALQVSNGRVKLSRLPAVGRVWADFKTAFGLLIERGAKINAGTAERWTPLHTAVEQGNQKIAAFLLQKKFDVNIRDGVGRTPLHKAVLNGHYAVVKLLLDEGADVNAAQLVYQYFTYRSADQ